MNSNQSCICPGSGTVNPECPSCGDDPTLPSLPSRPIPTRVCPKHGVCDSCSCTSMPALEKGDLNNEPAISENLDRLKKTLHWVVCKPARELVVVCNNEYNADVVAGIITTTYRHMNSRGSKISISCSGNDYKLYLYGSASTGSSIVLTEGTGNTVLRGKFGTPLNDLPNELQVCLMLGRS